MDRDSRRRDTRTETRVRERLHGKYNHEGKGTFLNVDRVDFPRGGSRVDETCEGDGEEGVTSTCRLGDWEENSKTVFKGGIIGEVESPGEN